MYFPPHPAPYPSQRLPELLPYPAPIPSPQTLSSLSSTNLTRSWSTGRTRCGCPAWCPFPASTSRCAWYYSLPQPDSKTPPSCAILGKGSRPSLCSSSKVQCCTPMGRRYCGMTAGACRCPLQCCMMPGTCSARPPGATRTSFPIPSSCTSQVGGASSISPSTTLCTPRRRGQT